MGWVGEIPKEDVALIREKADFDIDRILEIEQETRHDVVAFTRGGFWNARGRAQVGPLRFDFHLKPSTVFIFFTPNVRHLRARVTVDHVVNFSFLLKLLGISYLG